MLRAGAEDGLEEEAIGAGAIDAQEGEAVGPGFLREVGGGRRAVGGSEDDAVRSDGGEGELLDSAAVKAGSDCGDVRLVGAEGSGERDLEGVGDGADADLPGGLVDEGEAGAAGLEVDEELAGELGGGRGGSGEGEKQQRQEDEEAAAATASGEDDHCWTWLVGMTRSISPRSVKWTR